MFAAAVVLKLVVLCYGGSLLVPKVIEAWKLQPRLRHQYFKTITYFRLQYGGRMELKVKTYGEQQRQCSDSRATSTSTTETPYPEIMMNRRSMVRLGLVGLSPFVTLNKMADAEEEQEEEQPDLTNQLYNPDGSLKISNNLAAQTRLVSIDFSTSEEIPISGTEYARQVSIDGTLQPTTLPPSHAIRTSYQVPAKWTTPSANNADGYYDTVAATSSYNKACDRIIVYQQLVGEEATNNNLLLDRASTVGISKTLQLEDANSEWRAADLLSARRITKSGDDDLTNKYYFYDLAIAPKVCDSTVSKTSENLGLGFCPYDRIECTKDEWKCCNSDLKRIRDSFRVSALATKPRETNI